MLKICLVDHPAPLSQRTLGNQDIFYFLSFAIETRKNKDFIKLGKGQKEILRPVIVPGFMLTLMYHSCKKHFLLCHQNSGLQYKCTNPCNFLVMQATGVLISSRRGDVKSCQAHKTKKQTFRASLFPLFLVCLYSFSCRLHF